TGRSDGHRIHEKTRLSASACLSACVSVIAGRFRVLVFLQHPSVLSVRLQAAGDVPDTLCSQTCYSVPGPVLNCELAAAKTSP
ncbi:hypothetical protein GBF38_001301, partial [Nibea albiflora]